MKLCIRAFFVLSLPIFFVTTLTSSTPAFIDYAEGLVVDKTYVEDESSFNVLHLNRIDEDVLDQVSLTNPDIVCIAKVLDEEASAIYQDLKKSYAHFYQVKALASDTNNLLIASKYRIENLEYTLCPEEENHPFFVFFDFSIKKGDRCLGRCYVTDPNSAFSSERVFEKMGLDFLQFGNKNIPFFFSEDLALCEGVKTSPFLFNDGALLGFETIVKCPYKKNAISDWTSILCKDEGGYYDVSASKNSDGQSKAHAEMGYYKETKDDNFSAAFEAHIEKDRFGETQSSVGVRVKGKF